MFKTLKSRLFVTYMLALLIIISILSGILYLQQKNTLTTIIQENSMAQSKLYADHISAIVTNHLNLVISLSKTDEAKAMDHDGIFLRFQELIDNPDLLVFTGAILHPDGTTFDINGTSDTALDRQYYYDIFEDKAPYVISDPFMGKFRNNPVVVLVAPIVKNTEIIGGLILPLNLNDISLQLDTVELTENSYGWIIHNDGYVIAHPNPDFLLTLNVLDGDNNGFKGLSRVAQSMFEKKTGFDTYYDETQKITKMISFTEVENTPGWHLGISTPETEIYAPMHNYVSTLYIVLIISIVFALILALGFSSTMTKPLHAITEAVTNMRKGHIEAIPNVTTVKEISTLVSAFNEMSLELNDLSENFEFKVGQRTNSLKEVNEYLNNLATRDQLTGLYNRTYLIGALDELKTFSDSHEEHYFGLLFIDLNNFKYYNDTFGHDKGDELIKLSANLIKDHFRAYDIISRYGGDEFIVVLVDINQEHFNQVIEAFKLKVTETINFKEKLSPIVDMSNVPDDEILGFAVGHSYYSIDEAQTIDRMIQIADQRMYEHKAVLKRHFKS